MKMDWCRMGSLPLMFIVLIATGVQSLKLQSPGGARSMEVPWRDELCCDSARVPLTAEDVGTAAHWTGFLHGSQCNFRSRQQKTPASGAPCADVACHVDAERTALTCELHSDHPALRTAAAAMSFQPVSAAEMISVPGDPVICERNVSLKCSLALGSSSGVVLNISVAGVAVAPVHLNLPPTPVKPSAPVNLSHHQTIEAELVLTWENTPEAPRSLRHEVRCSPNTTETTWRVLQAVGEQRLILDLDANVNFTLQVRSSSLLEPARWSDWSEPHHVHLDSVSYIPEIVKVRPGEAVTIHCVFNDRSSVNASSASWILNFEDEVDSSQHQPVNQWVSQITVRPLETTLYDIVLCSQENPTLYSQIYVEGASVNITCQTDGDINAMDCNWEIKEPTNPKFLSRWSFLTCDEMEQRESAGEELGEPGPVCTNQRSCQIKPLMMNCYRLWLQMDSPLGPIDSKPVYVSPIENVKPRRVSHIVAETRSTGILAVSWDPPILPKQGVRCQLGFHPPTSVGEPEWSLRPPVLGHGDEVHIQDMCASYPVRVRCQPLNSTGYWSNWSNTVYSVLQNSTAPERGPDFWRILSHGPRGNQTTVTLIFKDLKAHDGSCCVEGLMIRHQPLHGEVRDEQVRLTPIHRFIWNHEVHTVTVKAFNRMGFSEDNFNMTLSRQTKRQVFQSFHVQLVNSTCVSVSWTAQHGSSRPQYMVLQWTPYSPRDTDIRPSSPSWRRLRCTDRPLQIRGEFFDSEEYDFYLFPVYSDGEGEPAHTRAVRREPGAYMLLMIISFLSVMLLVTLVLTQSQMKKVVWKEVPNPNKCSWAKGLDLRKVDTLEHLLRAPDALPSWPLLPTENISTLVIVDKADLPALAQPHFMSFPSEPPKTPLPTALNSRLQDAATLTQDRTEPFHDSDGLNPGNNVLLPSHAHILEITDDHSAQFSVTYTSVIPSDPQTTLRSRDSSGCSSSDEGNFSANNSDISDSSSHSALWETESCRDRDSDNRRSCSCSSELDDDDKQEKDLYYLTLNGEESEEEQDGGRNTLLKSIVLSKGDCSCPLLDPDETQERSVLRSPSPCGSSPLYLPQYRTAPITARPNDP